MSKIRTLPRNRNFILLLAITLGLVLGREAAVWTQPLLLPILALVMTLSTASITSRDLASLKTMPIPVLTSLLLNYVVMGGITILISTWLIDDRQLWAGMVVIAAVPPAVAVVPFSYLLGANMVFSVAGLVATYLAALAITPALLILFLDLAFFDPVELIVILGQLIVIPLVASRILLMTGLTRRIDKWRGTTVNWSFFVIVFTIIGLNRQVFFGQFDVLLKIAVVAVAITFILGYAIELTSKALHVDRPTGISWILIGTRKNYGLASVISLTLLDERAAIPGAICLVFAVSHFIWLSLRFKGNT
jgi:BASS family bile acid:Na+ symporter